jgi:hypothetical protein
MDSSQTRHQLERVLFAKLRDEHGDTAIRREPFVSKTTGFNYGDRDVPADYLAAVEAANQLADHARGMAREYALRARSLGRSWREVAGAFGLDHDDIDDPAVAAFERVAGTDWNYPKTYWTCGSCEQRITDNGPYSANPDGTEEGHRGSCERHERDTRGYRTEFDIDQDWGFER